jgi:phosphatidylserine/phosphatidylglycerophosphate/cardiolipin synthase-like enzyme
MTSRFLRCTNLVAMMLLGAWIVASQAHQDPCHRLHACPSDQNTYFLANQGVPTMIDAEHAMAHNKILIIDGETVLRGSFNFTKAAREKNAENLLIIRDPALAAQYTQNWEAHRQHSQPYVGRGVRE